MNLHRPIYARLHDLEDDVEYSTPVMVEYACNLLGVDSRDFMEEALKEIFPTLDKDPLTRSKIDCAIEELQAAYMKQEIQYFAEQEKKGWQESDEEELEEDDNNNKQEESKVAERLSFRL